LFEILLMLLATHAGDAQLIWAFAIVALMGLVFGFWFRVPAIFAASVIIVPATIGLAPLSGHSLMTATVSSVALLGVLQGAYLLGLVIAIGCGRVRQAKSTRLPTQI
jgi:hypothetical protein